ncbi:MAG: methionine--tRNA ligase [Candidatus Woesearchaeota archaeon]
MISEKQKKILITSALPYVNNIPHLGNLIGSVLSADVFARYCRLAGRETLYICGADEHGTATETKARQEGLTPKELCDKYFGIHKHIYDWFEISFDIFGRTSEENHHRITQDLFKKVRTNGYVKQDTVTQPFCKTCNSFLADRFITGTCPHCGYEDARGDQCDGCGKLLDPQELIDPKCKADGSTPEFRETEHLFLELDKLQPYLQKWVETASKEGGWTDNSIRTTNGWFREGLRKRAISRDLEWGIPIPYEGFEDKVFYVWFDAPIGYISITEQLTGDWRSWWQDPENVSLYQFMGKDNIPFHSIIFPATLIASSTPSDTPVGSWSPAQVDYTLVHHLNATEYINYEHGKFSKSRGVGVFGDNAKDSGIPADVFRYVLLYNRPESADTQFTWNGLKERLNNELVANLGNLVNRTITFTSRFFDGKVAGLDENRLDDTAKSFLEEYRAAIKRYKELMDAVRLREALQQLMKISSLGNHFFQESAPWKSRKDNPGQAQIDLTILVNIVKDLGILCEPFMPATARNIFIQLNLEKPLLDDAGVLSITDHQLGTPQLLFEKIDDDRIEELKTKYGGKQQEIEQEIPTGDETMDEQLPISKAQLKVGKITEVMKHPKADKLYIEKVDLGDGKETQIVSGLVPHYTTEELEGKHIVVLTNLKPAKLRGEWSNGMLLAADDKKGNPESVGLILAPESEPGTLVTATDVAPAPVGELSFDDFMKISFRLEGGIVKADGHELTAEDGKSIVADRVTDGIVS